MALICLGLAAADVPLLIGGSTLAVSGAGDQPDQHVPVRQGRGAVHAACQQWQYRERLQCEWSAGAAAGASIRC